MAKKAKKTASAKLAAKGKAKLRAVQGVAKAMKAGRGK